MGDTFEALQRHVGRIRYNAPNLPPEADIMTAMAFVCHEIDEIKKQLEAIAPSRDIMD